jgi:hypothetical protein
LKLFVFPALCWGGDFATIFTARSKRANEAARSEDSMTFTQWIGVGATIIFVGFIIFGFQQGLRVKPNKDARDKWVGLPPSGDNPPS